MRALPGVISVRVEEAQSDTDETVYEVELIDGVDLQDFLKTLVAAGVPVTRFEQAGVTLHDIFVTLAGEASDEAAPSLEAAE